MAVSEESVRGVDRAPALVVEASTVGAGARMFRASVVASGFAFALAHLTATVEEHLVSLDTGRNTLTVRGRVPASVCLLAIIRAEIVALFFMRPRLDDALIAAFLFLLLGGARIR